MSEASVPDQSAKMSDQLVVLAGNEHRDVVPGDPLDHWHRLGPGHTRVPVLGWMGPVAFARTYGAAPGFDQDFATSWGPNDDQQISFRAVPGGDDTGLLYVYDPTWNEYAVIGTDVSLSAVETAFAGAPQFGEHGAVEDFVALLPNVPPVRPTLGPER